MNNNRFEYDGLKKKHFAQLHERIQSKYEEMQRKLQKSKSMDILSTPIDEDYVFKEKRYVSNIEISQAYEFDHKKVESGTYHVESQDIEELDVTYKDSFYFNEFNISQSESDLDHNGAFESEREELISDKFSGDDVSNTSVESLNTIPTEKDDVFCTDIVPTPKSFRQRLFGKREKKLKGKPDKTVNKEKAREAREKVEQLVLSNTLKHDIFKALKRSKVGTVTIALIKVVDLEEDTSDERLRIWSCRFRLGTEKYKSKIVKSNSSIVQWQELFNLNLFDDNMLEINLCDKDMVLGRTTINLSEMEKEKTHKMWVTLDFKTFNAKLFLLLTVSGTSLINTITDIDDYENILKRIDRIKDIYAWYRLKDEHEGVGFLSAIVYGAKGLAGHDCYCVLELGNERLQTHTEFKTNEPSWMKAFTYNVTDVTEILEVTVCDEKKTEEIGKISIPLLSIKNGTKKWYALKENRQRDRAKGNNPRILLEITLTWNMVKASFRVINPKESKYLETETKFDRQVFSRNLTRAKLVTNYILDIFKVFKTCFEWESMQWNITALILWLLLCWFFKVWMLPLMCLLPFSWFRPEKYSIINWKKYLLKQDIKEEDDELVKEEKQSLRQKISSLQEMVQTVQNGIGTYASLGERIKNLFNFTVPYLSFLAIFIITLIAFVMYIIPAKYILMIWGIHKFTRKILRPNRIPNNEILDLLSRVPDDDLLLDCEELPLENLPEEEKL